MTVIPMDPNGTWEAVTRAQSWSWKAAIEAWLSRRTDVSVPVSFGRLKGMATLQEIAGLDQSEAASVQADYRNTMVRLFRHADMGPWWQSGNITIATCKLIMAMPWCAPSDMLT